MHPPAHTPDPIRVAATDSGRPGKYGRVTIRHKGLRRWIERGAPSRLPQNRLLLIAAILRALQSAVSSQDLHVPGWQLHPLSGNRKGFWAVTVSRNWCIVFRFVAGDVRDVDLVDCH